MSPETDALVGMVLDGTHRIEGLLSQGGMAAVYEATQLRLDKRVAIKVISRELATNPEALERFRREARVTSAIGHPNIVQVSDFSTTPTGEPYLVMEFLEGEDLDSRLNRVGHLPAAEVGRIMKSVASALAAAHAKGVVHRDLKPGNIYLVEVPGEPDFVKVLDFGISKVRSEPSRITDSAALLGTPYYMSPEQALGQTEAVDESTDQWALACIAWECLAGEVPFGGDQIPSVLFRVVHEPLPALAPKVEGLPSQVEAVLARALSKSKTDRFPSVVEFAAALDFALTAAPKPKAKATLRFGDGSSSRELAKPAGASSDGTRPAPLAKAAWRWPVLAGVVGVALVGLLFAMRSRPGSAPRVEPRSSSPETLAAAPIPSPLSGMPAPSAPVTSDASSGSQADPAPTPAPRNPGVKVEPPRRAHAPAAKRSPPPARSAASTTPRAPAGDRPQEDRWRVD